MSAPHILCEVVGAVGHIRLNRPERRNALSNEMKDQMAAAIARLGADPQVRAVLITAAGEHFMVGADLGMFRDELEADREGHLAGFEERVLATATMLGGLRDMAKPVVLACQGQTVGFGFCLAALADLVVAADDVRFILAYCHIALAPDAGITWTLPRLVGERRAKRIAFLGESLDAAKALDWGFVNEVVPVGELEERGWQLARRLAAGATQSIAASKALLGSSFERDWNGQIRAEAAAIARTVASDDHREGLDAFFEKRKPRFTGR